MATSTLGSCSICCQLICSRFRPRGPILIKAEQPVTLLLKNFNSILLASLPSVPPWVSFEYGKRTPKPDNTMSAPRKEMKGAQRYLG